MCEHTDGLWLKFVVVVCIQKGVARRLAVGSLVSSPASVTWRISGYQPYCLLNRAVNNYPTEGVIIHYTMDASGDAVLTGSPWCTPDRKHERDSPPGTTPFKVSRVGSHDGSSRVPLDGVASGGTPLTTTASTARTVATHILSLIHI